MTFIIPVLGITGKARVGKDTFADVLVNRHGFRKISFADPIRSMVSEMTGIPVQDLIDGPLKEQIVPWIGQSPRQLMQSLGTDWARNTIDQNIWLNHAKRRIAKMAEDPRIKGIVFADIRFDNEAFLIKELGGNVLHVYRPGVSSVNDHASEAGLKTFQTPFYVVNDGSLASFQSYAHAYGCGIANGLSVTDQQLETA